jgi:predicted N-acetyltransferase YhbS
MAAETVTIRTLKMEDLPAIAEIDTKVLGKKRPEYWENKLEISQSRSPVMSMVAESGGKVVGFILGEASGWEFGIPNTVAWIDTIGVDPDYQKKGVGRLLFKELLSHMKKVGVSNVYTLVNWKDWDLLKFFERVGFARGDMINLELKL